MCKVSLLKARISILSRLLQCFLKVLQNRSEKLKNAFPKAIIVILLGVFSDFFQHFSFHFFHLKSLSVSLFLDDFRSLNVSLFSPLFSIVSIWLRFFV